MCATLPTSRAGVGDSPAQVYSAPCGGNRLLQACGRGRRLISQRQVPCAGHGAPGWLRGPGVCGPTRAHGHPHHILLLAIQRASMYTSLDLWHGNSFPVTTVYSQAKAFGGQKRGRCRAGCGAASRLGAVCGGVEEVGESLFSVCGVSGKGRGGGLVARGTGGYVMDTCRDAGINRG